MGTGSLEYRATSIMAVGGAAAGRGVALLPWFGAALGEQRDHRQLGRTVNG